jgi:hypothetical protein
MLNFYPIVILLSFWHLSFYILCKFFDTAISKNIVHFIHALLFVIYYDTNYDKYYLNYVSFSFYFYDLLYILLQLVTQKNSLNRHAPYIIHHFIAIYGLYLSSQNIAMNIILDIYYILEKSNFMLYLAYHVNKKPFKNIYLIYSVEFIQYFWYTYFRVIVFSRYLFYNKEEIYSHNIILSYILLASLYFMGVYWSYSLFKKNIKNISLLIEEIKPKTE